jgi:hypothetical protein
VGAPVPPRFKSPHALIEPSVLSKKNIHQIIIYNRTDCCVDRLSNYQVSISNKADFSTHIYQQDFHVASVLRAAKAFQVE